METKSVKVLIELQVTLDVSSYFDNRRTAFKGEQYSLVRELFQKKCRL